MEMFTRIPTEIAYVIIAGAGGISRYLQLYLNEGKFAWKHFLAHTFISCFSGYMFYSFGANILDLDSRGMSILAGMGGWMGVEALKLLEAVIKKRYEQPQSK
jgi:hypothetical protein